VDVYQGVGLGIAAGYAIARWFVGRDASRRGAQIERWFVVALAVTTIVVLIVMFLQTQLQPGLLRTALRGLMIFMCSSVFTAAVSSFLMYAKADASRGRWN